MVNRDEGEDESGVSVSVGCGIRCSGKGNAEDASWNLVVRVGFHEGP